MAGDPPAICSRLVAPILRLRKQAIHAGDSVEITGVPRETGGSPVLNKGKFPFGKRGAKATQNGNHNLVHV